MAQWLFLVRPLYFPAQTCHNGFVHKSREWDGQRCAPLFLFIGPLRRQEDFAKMESLEEKRVRLLDCPVIAAVKDEAGLDRALQSECEAVFLLFGTLVSVPGLVEKVRGSGKLAIVHIDLVEGLSAREVAVDALQGLCRPDGIISTRPPLIRRARHLGLLTVQRAFILDSLSLDNLPAQLGVGKPDFIEILPGIMPRVIAELAQKTRTPIIAGGLVKYKDEVMAAIRAGAVAVSTSSPAVWEM